MKAKFALLLAVATLFAGCRLTIAPSALTVTEKQEGSAHDEPYFAVVKFRSVFGVAGSTEVVFSRNKISADSIEDGETLALPPELAQEMVFDDIEPSTDPGSLSSPVPIAGALILAMEADDFGWDPIGADGVKDSLKDTEACMRQALIEHVETTDWSTLGFAVAFQNLRTDLSEGCADGGVSGGASGTNGLVNLLLKIGSLFGLGSDDLMGTAFIVQIGVPQLHFDTEIAPILAAGGAGCAPFLANPDVVAMAANTTHRNTPPYAPWVHVHWPFPLNEPKVERDVG